MHCLVPETRQRPQRGHQQRGGRRPPTDRQSPELRGDGHRINERQKISPANLPARQGPDREEQHGQRAAKTAFVRRRADVRLLPGQQQQDRRDAQSPARPTKNDSVPRRDAAQFFNLPTPDREQRRILAEARQRVDPPALDRQCRQQDHPTRRESRQTFALPERLSVERQPRRQHDRQEHDRFIQRRPQSQRPRHTAHPTPTPRRSTPECPFSRESPRRARQRERLVIGPAQREPVGEDRARRQHDPHRQPPRQPREVRPYADSRDRRQRQQRGNPRARQIPRLAVCEHADHRAQRPDQVIEQRRRVRTRAERIILEVVRGQNPAGMFADDPHAGHARVAIGVDEKHLPFLAENLVVVRAGRRERTRQRGGQSQPPDEGEPPASGKGNETH